MDLRQYLQAAYKHRWVLIIGLSLGVLVGAYQIRSTESSYEGTVTFFVSATDEGTASSANVGDQFALRRVNSYLALLKTDRLAVMVIADSGIDTTPAFVRSRISGGADVNTVLLEASFRHERSDVAFTFSESIARQFVELVHELERPEVGESTVRLEVVSGPSVSLVPVRTKLMMVTRAMAGLLVAAAIALTRELTDTRLHSIDEALEISDAPLLGLIHHDRRTPHAPLILADEADSTRAEAYRQLRTSLQFVDVENRAQVIVVTSSVSGEGKSTTAANLAIALAQAGQSVVLVDADLRRPLLGQLFSIDQSIGLTDVLLGSADLTDVLQPFGATNLTLVPAGTPPPNPSELLGTVATRRVLNDLRARFDMVVIDSPPLVPVTDAVVVSTLADGVVLLVRPDKVPRAQLARAVAQLDRVGARLLGFVGSMTSERSSESYGAYRRSSRTPDGGGETRPTAADSRLGRSAQPVSALDEALDEAQSRLEGDRRRARRGASRSR